MTLKHIKFAEEDLQAVAQVQRLYGCESFSHAVRLAARIAARQKRIDLPLLPVPKHAEERHPKSLRGIIQLPENVVDAMDDAISQVQRQADQEVHNELKELMGDE
ncbi:MAG: hypothetical protein R2932_25605 [Caldilineaceae bacterium]